MKFKFSAEHYYRPTPKSIRQFGDSLLAGAMTISTISFANDYKTVAMVVLIAAGIGKFLSNFFSEDTDSTTPPTPPTTGTN